MVKDFYQIQGFDKINEDEEGNTTWRYTIQEHYDKKNRVIKVNESI